MRLQFASKNRVNSFAFPLLCVPSHFKTLRLGGSNSFFRNQFEFGKFNGEGLLRGVDGINADADFFRECANQNSDAAFAARVYSRVAGGALPVFGISSL